MKRRATILTAVLAVLGTAGSAAHSAPTSPQDRQPTVPSTVPATQASAALDYSDRQVLAQLLHDAATAPDQRDFAAQRLLAIGTSQAVDDLSRGLAPGAAPAAQIAVASAVANAPRAEARLREPLMTLLTADGPANVKREVGRALATFREDPAVGARLAELAGSNASLTTRQGAVAGLARIPSRGSVQALVGLLEGNAPEALERDAGEALRFMTGKEIAPDDLAGWQQWWTSVQDLDETAFKAQLMDLRASDAMANSRRAEAAAAALLAATQQRYRTLAPPQQVEMLEEYLRSPVAELREVAIRLVLLEEVNYARDVPPGIMRLVRVAITDPESRVRGVAALIVQRRNDTAAVESLLTQVGKETNPAALIEEIRALGSLGDAGALPMLLGLLNNPSPSARTAAARAAATLATSLDASAVRQAASAIRQAFEATDASTRSGQKQRAELITALADLRDPSLADLYRRILSAPSSTPRDVLVQALRGAGTLGNSDLGDMVAQLVSDADPNVQEQAVRALATTSMGFERQRELRDLLARDDVPESVRRAAWETLVALFPKARASDLESLAEFLRGLKQFDRRLVVQQALAQAAQSQQDLEQLAWRRQEMAETLMNDLDRPGEAAELWRQALDYSLENGPPVTLLMRAENSLRCYLRAGRFEDAISFAREMIDHNAGFRENVGSMVKRVADEFVQAGQPGDARSLIDAVLREDPPLLEARFRTQLEQQRQRLPADSSGD